LNRFASEALAARVGGWAFFAIQASCEDAGGAGFARASRPNEQIRVCDFAAGDGVAERARNVVLPYKVIERLGSILAIKG
jgi:hypothetical protein